VVKGEWIMIDDRTPEQIRQQALAKLEAANHCDDYTVYLYERNEALQMIKLADTLERQEKYLKCQTCGVCNESVTETIDPYEDELYNEKIIIKICPDCLHERFMEI
jgi:hypothetical protein